MLISLKKYYKNFVTNSCVIFLTQSILSISLFLLITRNFFIYNFSKLSLKFQVFFEPLNYFDTKDNITGTLSLGCLTFMIYFYFSLKLSGVFHLLKNTRLILAIIIILFIDILYNYSTSLTVQLFPLKTVFHKPSSLLFISSINFILHKFFNFLTLKFPTPFKQIGYVSSFECYKNLFLKLKEKIIRK